ncbi:MAG: WecB/TagA/CpsF family glycosyltransferase [Verrucomicrobia bacterium]|nr:WecB/TagA/CpsF family glycosyltransferase [Leptolyngbya sp. ES-bin-22]
MQKFVPLEAPEPFSVLGLPVHLLDDYTGWLVSRAQQQQGCHVVTLNAEMAMAAEHNLPLAAIIRYAELVIPDGAGIVLYLKLYGRSTQRCPGIELAESLLREFGRLPSLGTVAFLGGQPDVIQKAKTIWQERAPGLAIAIAQHGYLSPEDEPAFLQTLKDTQPQLILVGLGVPRQEFWIAKHRHLCPNAIWIGVGGSFDIWAGVKTRAPGWLRDNHLEWVYRLYQEPWRWRRMLALPKFAWRSVVYRLTRK